MNLLGRIKNSCHLIIGALLVLSTAGALQAQDNWVLRVYKGRCQETRISATIDGVPRNIYINEPFVAIESTTGVISGNISSTTEETILRYECIRLDDNRICDQNGQNCYQPCHQYDWVPYEVTTCEYNRTVVLRGESCYSSVEDNIRVELNKKMSQPTLTSQSCGSAQFQTTSIASSYAWEVTDNPNLAASWRLVGDVSSTLVLTPSDLGDLNQLGNLYARVRDSNCSQRVSDPTAFRLYTPSPVINLSSQSPSCRDGKDGKIIISITSGFAPQYEVQISKGGIYKFRQTFLSGAFPKEISRQMLEGNILDQGVWRVEVANVGASGDCYSVNEITVPNPEPFEINSNSISNVRCNGEINGEVKLNVIRGSPAFSYFMDAGAGFLVKTPDDNSTRTPSFSGLGAGTYSFKAAFQNPTTGVTCESNVLNGVIVEEPIVLSATETSKSDNLCHNKNRGEINTTITGGNGGYSYTWSATGSYEPYTVPAVEDLTNLYAGNYSLTVTDSKGCSNASPLVVEVAEPSQPVIARATVASRAFTGGFDMTCAQNDGMINLDLDNETPPIEYTWSREGEVFETPFGNRAEGLRSGNYSITVLDHNNCDASTSITLYPHPGITANLAATSNYNGYNTSCPDSDDGAGRVTSVTNAYGALSYAWFNGSTNRNIFDLLPGNYAVTVIDGNGCTDDGTLTIIPPPAIDPQVQAISDYNGEVISCPDATDGILEAFPTNGLTPYSYSWEHGPATKSVTALGAGTYTVTVTDSYNCAVTESYVLIEPDPMHLTLTKTSYNGSDLTCHDAADGAIQLQVQNGITPYSYSWSNNTSDADVSGLPHGEYSVTVTDTNGCTQNASATIQNPDLLEVEMRHVNDFNGFDISCGGFSDGSAMAFGLGGTAPYRYHWSNDQTTNTINSISAGLYVVNVRDINNCSAVSTITVTEPPPLEVYANVDITVSCHSFSDAQVSLVGDGGVGDYSYSMDANTYQELNFFMNLDAGEKNFYMKDANGCVISEQKILTQPDPLAVDFRNIVDSACEDPVGSAQAVITGGNGKYAIEWFDDLTDRHMNSGSTLSSALASIYRAEISDQRNCRLTDWVAVSSIGGAEFRLENITPVSCFGYSDGSASISGIEGVEPVSLLWSDSQTSETAIGLSAGNYFAMVTDGLGCRTIRAVTIQTPAVLSTSFNKTLPDCVGDCNGSIEVSIAGGTMPYSSDWTSLGRQGASVNQLCAGSYDLTIVDSNNCRSEQSVELTNPNALQLDPLIFSPSCLGRCDGSIEVSGVGGTGPYKFQWQDGPMSSIITLLCPGDYKVTMKDDHDCLISNIYTIKEGEPLPVDLGGEATLCVGQIKVLDPGDEWTAVEWTSTIGFESSTQSIAISDPGEYFFKGIDERGCLGFDSFKLMTSIDLLTAEFLMPSEATVGDTLVAIDVSWPLPERVEWFFPADFIRLPNDDSAFLYAKLPEVGTYKIGMKSFLAECTDFQEKILTVRSPESGNEGGRLGYPDELLSQFLVFPNPNDGRFRVKVELLDAREIDLKIVSFPERIIVSHHKLARSDSHDMQFDLADLPAGVHVVLLTVDGNHHLLRFIKSK